MPGVDLVANVMIDVVDMIDIVGMAALLSLKSTKGAARNQIFKKHCKRTSYEACRPRLSVTPPLESGFFLPGKSLEILRNCKDDGDALKPMLALQRCHKVQILYVWE